jgi:hypothetical protein
MDTCRALVFLSIEEEYMRDRRYDMLALGVAYLQGRYDEGICRKVTQKSDLREVLREFLGYSNYKIKKCIDGLLDIGMLEEYDKEYIIMPIAVQSNFIKVDSRVIEKAMRELDSFSFKIYCYLYGKHQANRALSLPLGFRFSRAQLLDMSGYSYCRNNLDKVDDALDKLVEGEYISCSKGYAVKGKNGWYKELFSVF